MSSLIFDSYLHDREAGNVVPESDTIYVMLVSGYTPNKATHTKRSDVTGEVTGTGYTAGGVASAVSLVALDTTNHRQDITLGAVSWSTATISATGAVYYKHRGGLASADELIAYDDFGGTVTSTGGSFALGASTLRIQN